MELTRKKGLTLIELIIAMVVTTIAGLAITLHYVAEQRFRARTEDRTSISKEARIAMDLLTRTLRFADPGTVSIESTPAPFDVILTATIKADHLDRYTIDTPVRYGWTDEAISTPDVAANTLSESADGGATWSLIATDIVAFSADLSELGNRKLTIMLSAQSGRDEPVGFQTTIRILGE